MQVFISSTTIQHLTVSRIEDYRLKESNDTSLTFLIMDVASFNGVLSAIIRARRNWSLNFQPRPFVLLPVSA